MKTELKKGKNCFDEKVSQFENTNINKNLALISPIEITENNNTKNILAKEIFILRMKMKLS